jgi:23S rRNA pseudouridine1911/1915/1917 synthase
MRDEVSGEFTITTAEASQRLDACVAARLGCSRARVQHGIEAGEVLVNGRVARSSYKVRAGDAVEVELAEVVEAAVIPENLPLSVLHEDADLAVIDKPAGMVVHPAGDIARGTLANALAHRWGIAPGLVHRLDRDTSGVMVVARTDDAKQRLTAQFRSREVSKRYVALVYGRVPDARGTIAVPIARDQRNRLKMITCDPGEGREALTHYEVRERWDDFTLLDVEIETGRTHQIRVHCAHLGHPVVADEMYGRGRASGVRHPAFREAIAALGRQFLHAARLGFDHPSTRERLVFEAPLHEDLSTLLEAVRRGPT